MRDPLVLVSAMLKRWMRSENLRCGIVRTGQAGNDHPDDKTSN